VHVLCSLAKLGEQPLITVVGATVIPSSQNYGCVHDYLPFDGRHAVSQSPVIACLSTGIMLCAVGLCLQAVLSGGQLYVATATVAADKNTPSYSRRPAIAWAQLRVLTSTEGTDSCPQSRAGAISRQAWDWAKDYSVGWGQAVGAGKLMLSAWLQLYQTSVP